VAEALERAGREPVVEVEPRVERPEGGDPTVRLPAEAGYEVTPEDIAEFLGVRHSAGR
jgi:hypothetical protein